MVQVQKKIGGDDNPAKQKQMKIGDDTKAKSAVEKAKDALKDADKALARKGGRYVTCCGIRTWVPD